MKNLHSFVSDYTKDKKHLHLVIGIIRRKILNTIHLVIIKRKV